MNILPSDILPGDLVVSRTWKRYGPTRLYDTGIRLYTDPQCDAWDSRMNERTIALALYTFPNKYKQDIIALALPQGLRWVYEQDVIRLKLFDPDEDDPHTPPHDMITEN
jgi:hypothetical protein